MISRLLLVRPPLLRTPLNALRILNGSRFVGTESIDGSASTSATPPPPSSPTVVQSTSSKLTPTPKPFDPSVPPASLLKPGVVNAPRTHPVALLHFRTYHPPTLEFFLHFAYHAALALDIPLSHPARLPIQRSLFTVPKSPFIFKKAQENFERKVHKRAVKVWNADPEVVGVWLRYLEEHMMPGIGMRVVRWEREAVGFGAARLEEVGRSLRDVGGEAKLSVGEQVKAIGERIVKEETEAAKKAREADLERKPEPTQ